MPATEILQALPATLPWLVLFRLERLRPFTGEVILRRMFNLPEQIDPIDHSHVVLSPMGTLVVRSGTSRMELADSGVTLPAGPVAESVFARNHERLALLPAQEPDCLGVGRLPGHQPVVLYVTIDGLVGEALAVFATEPDRGHYELLRAVGVEFVGGGRVRGGYLARFRNHLDLHILAGALAGFRRTDYCNQFFLRGGAIDGKLRNGLLAAAHDRRAHGRERALAALTRLARQALRQTLALVCQPPPPAHPYEYGDLVPLGFVLAALRSYGDQAAADAAHLRDHLMARQRDGAWSYHSGGLVTATDSSLVLQGLNDPQAVEKLEQFRVGEGYVPQLWGELPEPGRMEATDGNRHWCQVDLPTTCLIRGLRGRAGLRVDDKLAFLTGRFETRGGLYFANPYLTDWAVANGIARDQVGATSAEGEARAALANRLTADPGRHQSGLYLRPVRRALIDVIRDPGPGRAWCRRRRHPPGPTAPAGVDGGRRVLPASDTVLLKHRRRPR
jgi:hypothetical protein